jgi:CheY-like chemotaxis protein
MENGSILLVEDNPDDVELTLRAFRKASIETEIIVMRDGVEALDYLFGMGPFKGRDLNIKPTVILLDLKLPKVDGLEVLERLRKDERTGLLPVVILTASREERDLFESYRLGANSYIRKPVDFNQFADLLKHIGIYWMAINEPPPKKENNNKLNKEA